LTGEVNLRDAKWSCHDAPDTIPPAEVGVGAPVAQGSFGITGDAVLEIGQRLQINVLPINYQAMNVANFIREQQQSQQ